MKTKELASGQLADLKKCYTLVRRRHGLGSRTRPIFMPLSF
jgi:hypothetical protein